MLERKLHRGPPCEVSIGNAMAVGRNSILTGRNQQNQTRGGASIGLRQFGVMVKRKEKKGLARQNKTNYRREKINLLTVHCIMVGRPAS